MDVRILVVEDEGIVAKDIQRSLQNLGYTVCGAAFSGEEAMKEAEENKPDIVLMDIVLLGEVDGIEAANKIQARFNIPVIYLTAYADDKTLERAKISEPFGYIIKPFEDRDLHTTIQMALYKHKMEMKLRQSEKWLSTTLQSIGDAVIATDPKGSVIFMNPVAEALTGWKHEDAKRKPLKDVFNIINENTRNSVEDPAANVLREGLVVGLANHTVLISKDGTETPIDDSGAPIRDDKGDIIGVVLVFRDVSERRKAEEAMRQSEQRYRTLFEDSRDAIYMTTREGEFFDVNQSAIDLFGYTREEMIGLDVRKIYASPADRRRFQQEIEEKGSVKHYEVKLRNKDGKEMYCLLTASVRRATDGSILGYQGIIHDVTEQKRLEDKLQQAQRMEAIGTLAGGIAHDFNNLLMGIQGNVSLMLMDIDSTHIYCKRLKTIERQIQGGASLTSHLLGYARKGKYEVKPVDLNHLVRETSDTFGRTKKDITIQRELAEDLFTIEADQGQIEQVILNLFVNAADAMPGGGALMLKTSNVTHKDVKGKLYDPKPGNYVLLTVIDTGVGMSKKTMERIFDPFFTTKERGHGTGLGLASAYGIIKSHNGYIDVESRRRKGTTFSLYLPASMKKLQRVVKPDERITKGAGTILLVDDEDVILNVGKDLLEAMGYRVLLAKDGEEAVEVYKKNLDRIDIVVLDLVMPTMGGGEAYERMSKINPDIKVLLSSGYSIEGKASEILERGCNGFIQKPFKMKDLSRAIRKILGKK